MMNKIRLAFVLGFLALATTVWIQQRRITKIKAERDRHEQNSNALFSEMEQWQIDSTTMATNVKSLRFSVQQLEEHRADDAAKIEAMGVKIHSLEAAAKHSLEVSARIEAPVRDTIIIREQKPIIAQTITMQTPHISMSGTIEQNHFSGIVTLPVTLRQAVWIDYKRVWLFWKRPKAINQTITCDNPHVKINYSEYIKVEK